TRPGARLRQLSRFGDLSMRERWPLSIVGEGLRPARLAPPQVWAELPLKRCHAQAVRASMLLRLRQEPPTVAERSLKDRAERSRGGIALAQGWVRACRGRPLGHHGPMTSLESLGAFAAMIFIAALTVATAFPVTAQS